MVTERLQAITWRNDDEVHCWGHQINFSLQLFHCCFRKVNSKEQPVSFKTTISTYFWGPGTLGCPRTALFHQWSWAEMAQKSHLSASWWPHVGSPVSSSSTWCCSGSLRSHEATGIWRRLRNPVLAADSHVAALGLEILHTEKETIFICNFEPMEVEVKNPYGTSDICLMGLVYSISIYNKSGVKRLNTLGHLDQYMAQNGRIVKQS